MKRWAVRAVDALFQCLLWAGIAMIISVAWVREKYQGALRHQCSKCGARSWVQCETCYYERHHF